MFTCVKGPQIDTLHALSSRSLSSLPEISSSCRGCSLLVLSFLLPRPLLVRALFSSHDLFLRSVPFLWPPLFSQSSLFSCAFLFSCDFFYSPRLCSSHGISSILTLCLFSRDLLTFRLPLLAWFLSSEALLFSRDFFYSRKLCCSRGISSTLTGFALLAWSSLVLHLLSSRGISSWTYSLLLWLLDLSFASSCVISIPVSFAVLVWSILAHSLFVWTLLFSDLVSFPVISSPSLCLFLHDVCSYKLCCSRGISSIFTDFDLPTLSILPGFSLPPWSPLFSHALCSRVISSLLAGLFLLAGSLSRKLYSWPVISSSLACSV